MENITQRIAHLYNRGMNDSFLHLHFLDDDYRQCFSYRDFIREAWAWKLAFSERGLYPADRVIIILPHGLDMYASFCGALLGGLVPAFFAFPSSKLSKADYFSSVKQLIDSVDGKLIVTYDALKDDLIHQAGVGFNGVMLTTSELEVGPFAEVGEFYQAAPNAVAFLQFSSGTTGLKKGVAISHQALLTQVDAYANAIQLNQSDVVVSWLPLYHDMGLITGYFLPLLTGVKVVAMSPFEWVKQPLSLLELISQYRGTLCWLPNFTYNLLAKVGASKSCDGLDLSSMRGFINCSEPVLDSSHQKFLSQFQSVGLKKSALSVCYAMAENTFAMTQSLVLAKDSPQAFNGSGMKVDMVDRERLAAENRAVPVNLNEVAEHYNEEKVRCNVSCGYPVAGTEISIVDESMAALPERSVGQIVIRSPCLFDRYFNNPDGTADSFYGGLFLTGDTGYMAEGELYVIGRSKDTIIINGKNIYPQDIEDLLNGIDGVIPGRNVALGIFNESSGSDQLVLIIESNRVVSKELAHLKGGVYTSVNSHFEIQVADICIVEHQWLKKSTSGKISRKINRQRYLSELRQNAPLKNEPFDNQSGNERFLGNTISEGITSEGESPKNSPEITLDKVRRCVHEVVSMHSAYPVENLTDDQSLVNSGIIDSLSLAGLLASLEYSLGVNLPDGFASDVNDIDSIGLIAHQLTVLNLKGAKACSFDESSKKSAMRSSQWYAKISKSMLEDDQKVKYQLLPQLEVSDHLLTLPHPQLGRICAGGIKSDSLNTDENGCRVWSDGQKVISLNAFNNKAGNRALVIGSSTAFGIGVSHDSKTFANQLNRLSESQGMNSNKNKARGINDDVGRVNRGAISFYNCSLRASVVSEEVRATELFFGGERFKYLIWFSGLNNVSFPLVLLAQYLAEIAAEEGHSGVAYKKGSWQTIYQREIVAPIQAEFKKLKDGPMKIIFCLQPVLTWIDKIQTAQEQALMHVFDSSFDLPLRQVLSVSLAPLYQCFRDDLARLCDENNIQFIDFNQDAYFASSRWLFVDRVHLTDLAHEHIAEVIYPTLAA